MSWDWSHSPEAYENARENLAKKLRGELRIIYAEIEAADKDEDGFYVTSTSGLNLELYEKKLKEAKAIANSDLVDRIWEFMEKFRTCDNGGFNAYCCPYMCHSVSFS